MRCNFIVARVYTSKRITILTLLTRKLTRCNFKVAIYLQYNDDSDGIDEEADAL